MLLNDQWESNRLDMLHEKYFMLLDRKLYGPSQGSAAGDQPGALSMLVSLLAGFGQHPGAEVKAIYDRA